MYYLWGTQRGSKSNFRADLSACDSFPLASPQEWGLRKWDQWCGRPASRPLFPGPAFPVTLLELFGEGLHSSGTRHSSGRRPGSISWTEMIYYASLSEYMKWVAREDRNWENVGGTSYGTDRVFIYSPYQNPSKNLCFCLTGWNVSKNLFGKHWNEYVSAKISS